MGEAPHVLAIDLGRRRLRAGLLSYDGTLTAWAQEPMRVRLPAGGGTEQSPQVWWTAMQAACAELGRQAPAAMAVVDAVCCTSEAEGTLPVDRRGAPLTDCILGGDMRGEAHLRRQFGGHGTAGFASSQVRRWLHSAGGMPAPTGKDPAAHMLFIRDVMPEVYERTAAFLSPLDYLNLTLSGVCCATHDSIASSWVTDNRSPERIRYDAALVRQSGIEMSKFPSIVAGTTDLGPVLPDVAATLGVPATARVIAGAVCNAAAAVGSGAIRPYETHLFVGASSWLAAHVLRRQTSVHSWLASLPCALPDRYLVTGLQATATGNLAFLRGVLGDREGSWTVVDQLDEPAMDAEVEALTSASPAGAGGLVYLPWIHGERAPVSDRNLRAGFLNLSLEHTRSDVIRAVLEGVAYNTRWLLGPVTAFLGRPVTEIALVGGGARSAAWAQIYADVLGVRVRQLAEPDAVSARGAAFIAGVGRGRLAFDDVPGLIRAQRTFTPTPAHRVRYDDGFETFLHLYRTLAPVYQRLNAKPTLRLPADAG